jgi:hypothetical protein
LVIVPKGQLSQRESLPFVEVGPADHVSLSVGDAAKEEIGLAWLGRTPDATQLRFRVVSTVSQTPSAEMPLSISSSVPLPPQLIFQEAGFGNTEPRGGWFLSWVDAAFGGQIFHVARMRDGNLQNLGQLPRPAAGIPLLFPSGGDRSDDEVAVGYARVDSSLESSKSETKPRWCQ